MYREKKGVVGVYLFTAGVLNNVSAQLFLTFCSGDFEFRIRVIKQYLLCCSGGMKGSAVQKAKGSLSLFL